MIPGRRKKWTEAEERTLIDKYGDMVSDGTLSKMKTREKKFRPICLHVNSVHHARDPAAFPWQWTWKDVSTKVQNMRHQYLLVKQKVKKPTKRAGPGEEAEDFDWGEGLAHWSNFLRYKEVFGDSGPGPGAGGVAAAGACAANGFGGLDVSEFEGEFELGLEYDGDGEESKRRRKRKKKRKTKKKKGGTERRRREEEEREWEERARRRRAEWRRRIDETLGRHREEMSQMQARILQEHQSLTSQLLGLISQWAPPHDHHAAAAAAAGGHYFAHMAHSGLVEDDGARVEGENQDEGHHFIVS